MADQNDLRPTGAEFAGTAKVTLRAIRNWAAQGIGPEPVRPAGTGVVRYRRREVEDLLSGKPFREAAEP